MHSNTFFAKLYCHQTQNVQVEGRKEGNVLFNDALNTFLIQLYDVGHMVKDHSYSKRKLTATTTWATVYN